MEIKILGISIGYWLVNSQGEVTNQSSFLKGWLPVMLVLMACATQGKEAAWLVHRDTSKSFRCVSEQMCL
jgi:hypothetical protein